MKTLASILVAVILSGCATVQSWLPSFWDDNQAAYITEVRLTVERVNCELPQAPQVLRLSEDLRRFELYSQAKGSLQRDVENGRIVVKVLESTAKSKRNC